MNTNSLGLAGLLALVLLVACDGGGEAKPAAPAKAEPGKSEPAKAAAPAKSEPAKAEPGKSEPAKPPEPAKVEPAPVPEPAPEPAKVEPPSEPEPAVAEPAEPPAEPAAVAVPPTAAGDGSTPISLGPNAEILRLVLAKDVVNRQPVEPGTSFPSGTKVNLFIESRNETEEDIQLSVTWENVASGRRSPPVGVKIPVRKLNRSRAYRTLKITGQHRAILLDASGTEIAALPFTIE